MMDKKSNAYSTLRKALPKIVFVLCVLQPLLDVVGFWQERLQVGNTVTMALRLLLLAGTVLLGFLLSDRKRIYLIAAGVLLMLTCGHVAACMTRPGGYVQPVTDLVNLVRIFFLPLMTLCFITFLRQNEKVYPAILTGMAADVLIIAAVQLISELTHTNPYTYSADSLGILGWFMWTNSQSAILAMLSPIVIIWTMRRWENKLLPVLLVTAVSEATLYVLAPRLAYASLIASGVGVVICTILADRKRWKQALAVLLVTVLFVAAYPLSNTYQRRKANEERTKTAEEVIQKENIVIPRETEPATASENETAPKPTDPDEKPAKPTKPVIHLEEETADKLEKLYRSQGLMWNIVECFGRDRVFEYYDYSIDPEVIANTRKMKIAFCSLAMEDSGLPSHLFGLNLVDMTAQRHGPKGELITDNYDVENDFHGVYFLTGWVGLVLMILFLLYFGIRALLRVIRRPKVYFCLPMCAFAMAYVLGLIHAYFTASVLRRNNASFYLALVLAGLWYLSRKQTEESAS